MNPLCPKCGAQIFRPICDWCGELISQPSYTRTFTQSLKFHFYSYRKLFTVCAVAVVLIGVLSFVNRHQEKKQNENNNVNKPKFGVEESLSKPSVVSQFSEHPIVSRLSESKGVRSNSEAISSLDRDNQRIPNEPQERKQDNASNPSFTSRSLPNETILFRAAGRGSGKLIVKNGTALDAVIKLVDLTTDSVAGVFYICSRQTGELTGIKDGEYILLFTQGADWDSSLSVFTSNTEYSKFDRNIQFVTRTRFENDSEIVETSINQITLHKVVGGNVSTTSTTKSEFTKYR